MQSLDLDFSGEGMHGLVGAPGSGKSSVFGGLMFSLYGTPGPDQDLLDLRYDQAADGATVVADYTWSHNGTVYRTRRELRRGNRKGKHVEKASARLWRDGTEVDNMTPTEMTHEVTTIIGMSDRSFAGSSLIRQGEVDTLTTASPAVVQQLVEDHTGLGEISKLRDAARKRTTEARAVADSLPGSLDDVQSTADAARTAHDHAATVIATADSAALRATRARSNSQDADQRATELRTQAQRAHAAREELVASQAALLAAQEAADRADRTVEGLGCDAASDVAAVQSRRDELAQRRTELADAGNAAYFTGKEVAAADSDAHTAKAAVDNCPHRADELRTRSTELEHRRDELSERQQQTQVEANTATAERTKLDKALTTLRDVAACCPTCQQHLEDPDALIMSLTAQRDAATRTIAAAHERATTLHHDLAATTTAMAEVRGSLDELEKLVAAAQQASARLARAESANTDAANRCATLTGTQPENAPEAVAHVRAVIGDIDTEITRLGEQRAAITTSHQAWDVVRQATQRHDRAREAMVDAPAPDVVDAAAAESARLRAEADVAAAESADAGAAANSAKMGCSQLDMAAETAAAQWTRKQNAVRDAEIAATTAEVLAAYRQDLIADFCAGISVAATELLERFGGEHVAFHLDADFVPRVELADGRMRKTSSLSGGEKARAGLAFRLGISMQITDSGLPDQVLGDEITSYLDEDGRRQVLATIAGLFASPIIVSHTSEIFDHATEIHRLHRNPLGVTTVVDDA